MQQEHLHGRPRILGVPGVITEAWFHPAHRQVKSWGEASSGLPNSLPGAPRPWALSHAHKVSHQDAGGGGGGRKRDSDQCQL